MNRPNTFGPRVREAIRVRVTLTHLFTHSSNTETEQILMLSHASPPKSHGGFEGVCKDVEDSLSLLLNLSNRGAGKAFVRISATCSVVGIWDRVIGKVHSGEVVTEDGRGLAAGVSEFEEKVHHPLDLGKSGCNGAILRLGRATTHGGLLGALPRYKV
ncbi:hypothetical protein PIB30_011791 [Stylosanthes scabra]|uniref:Uncharacterized protein n=1 Tax=Stylosanthes scabra TaxID=79078 RepID=A0ABU6R671_9FABA|nr:hypothetical protein [Stylosanthes scabra]